MAATYRSIAAPASAEFIDRKSRFISLVAPITTEDEAFCVLSDARAANPDARHNVWAYLLRDGRERCSDDGEPQKTAGLPTLEVLRRSGLSDLVAITTRYFGGVLLGTGGLVRAYTTAVQEALAAACEVEYTSCVEVACTLPYNLFEQVRRMASEAGGKPGEAVFTDTVALPILFREGEEHPFVEAVRELTRGNDCCRISEPQFCAF